MKKITKIILVLCLALGLGRYIFTQTSRGQQYRQEHLSPDIEFMRSKVLQALDATGVVLPDAGDLSTTTIEYSQSGTIIVDQATLDQRLEYYKKSKDKLWK